MDKRAEIIEAGRTVFAREGFHGATIGKIAAEAELKSPSLVYWYFKNKEELYQAILQDLSPVLNQLPVWWQRLDDPPEEMLPLISRTILRALDNPEIAQFVKIVLAEIARNPRMAASTGEKMILGLNFMISYLDRQIELERLRPHNTQSSARSFLGSFLLYLLSREFFIPLRAGLPDIDTYITDIVGVFLKGLENN